MTAVRDLSVLLVDDQDSMRSLAKICLNQIGVLRVIDVADGHSAFASMHERRFDLVICDWIMPDMDGLELLQKVRNNAILRRTPFIIASAQSARDKISQALNAGASVYVTKPFTAPELRKALELALGRFV
jgi:two-component system chemotaxis response regulator CheY